MPAFLKFSPAFKRIIFFSCFYFPVSCQVAYPQSSDLSGYSDVYGKIRGYIDTLEIIDTHEHLLNPALLRRTHILDFFLLLNHHYYNDLISAGMPASYFDTLFNGNISPLQKWKRIEPFWDNSFNTSFNRIAGIAARRLYGIRQINETTVERLSEKIREANFRNNWFDIILRDSCRIRYLIQDGENLGENRDYIKYVRRFTPWLNVRAKFTIDSLAMNQVEPIFTLEDFVKSMEREFVTGTEKGMAAVKIIVAYNRPLSIDEPDINSARRVFRRLTAGDEGLVITLNEAKPLQDYMFHKLMELAGKYHKPVAIHTGLLSGNGNNIRNSDPALLSNIFLKYNRVNFVLFHGSYPFGGELSAIVKNFPNVYIDMNWVYAISPSYSKRYLSEWLETVPVSKIMAFGGDYNIVENIYAEYFLAKQVISEVLAEKVMNGYFTSGEALKVARMILHDNAAGFYGLP